MVPAPQRPTQARPLRRLRPEPEPWKALALRNSQRLLRVDMRLLRRILQALLRETWPDCGFDLAIYLVSVPEITRLNEVFLRHKGATDVITFDYAEKAEPESPEPPSWPRSLTYSQC